MDGSSQGEQHSVETIRQINEHWTVQPIEDVGPLIMLENKQVSVGSALQRVSVRSGVCTTGALDGKGYHTTINPDSIKALGKPSDHYEIKVEYSTDNTRTPHWVNYTFTKGPDDNWTLHEIDEFGRERTRRCKGGPKPILNDQSHTVGLSFTEVHQQSDVDFWKRLDQMPSADIAALAASCDQISITDAERAYNEPPHRSFSFVTGDSKLTNPETGLAVLYSRINPDLLRSLRLLLNTHNITFLQQNAETIQEGRGIFNELDPAEKEAVVALIRYRHSEVATFLLIDDIRSFSHYHNFHENTPFVLPVYLLPHHRELVEQVLEEKLIDEYILAFVGRIRTNAPGQNLTYWEEVLRYADTQLRANRIQSSILAEMTENPNAMFQIIDQNTPLEWGLEKLDNLSSLWGLRPEMYNYLAYRANLIRGIPYTPPKKNR